MTAAPGRRRAAALCVAALAAGALGACSEGAGGGDARAVTVYLSMPLRGESGEAGRDVSDAARLALAEAGGEAAGVAIRLEILDASEERDDGGRGWTPARAAANAREATRDASAIAYLGDFESGATRASLPITNEARMLQVSPASTASDLVAPFPGSDEVPEAQPSGERTFARVIPADDVEADVAAAWLGERGARSVAVVEDGSAFAEALAVPFSSAAEGTGLELVATVTLPASLSVGPPSDPIERAAALRRSAAELRRAGSADALFYAGYPAIEAGELAALAEAVGAEAALGSDSLLDPAFLEGVPAAAVSERLGSPVEIRVVSAALDPSQLPPAGRDFVARFEREHGRRPGRYAAYGYEAMAALIEAIASAGEEAGEREAVRDAFFETERDAVLGRYAIDELGETTLERLGAYRLTDGRLHPAAALEAR